MMNNPFKFSTLTKLILLTTASASSVALAEVKESDQRLNNLTLSGSNSYATDNVSSFGHSAYVLSDNSVNLGHSSTVLGASLDKEVNVSPMPQEPKALELEELQNDASYSITSTHNVAIMGATTTLPYFGSNETAYEFFLSGNHLSYRGGPTEYASGDTGDSPFSKLTTVEYEAKKAEIQSSFMEFYNSASDVEKEYINAIINLTDGTLKEDNLWNGKFYVFLKGVDYAEVKDKIGIEAYSANLASETLRDYFLTYADINKVLTNDQAAQARFGKVNDEIALYIKSFDANAAVVAAENDKIAERNNKAQAEYDVAKAAYDQQVALHNKGVASLTETQDEIKAANGEGYVVNVGVGNLASGDYSVTVGSKSKNVGENAVSIGANNVNAAENATLLGSNISVPKEYANTVVLGANSMPAAANPEASITIRDKTYEFAGKTPESTLSIGSVGKERQITNVAAGRISATSTDAINGSQLYAVFDAVNNLKVESSNPANTEFHLTFKDENGNTLPVSNEGTVTVIGGKNINTEIKNGVIEVRTADDVNVNSVTATTIKSGDVTINANGINAGNKNITNVKDGEVSETSKDAVNGSQLHRVTVNVANLNNRVGRLEKENKRLKGGIAGTNAAAALPQVRGNGKSMLAAAAGHYDGQNAVAVGYSRASDSGRTLFKAHINANTQGKIGGGVGVGYEW